MAVRYVADDVAGPNDHGWLAIKWEDAAGGAPAIPLYLKVDWTGVNNGRDYFTVLEGIRTNRKGSVKQKPAGGSYLTANSPHAGPAKMTFNVAQQKLTIDSLGAFAAITYSGNPVPKGIHDVEVPDEPHHQFGDGYLPQSAFATTWFRIGHSGDRYLHPGRVSAGCITITEVPKWTQIYKFLINRRAAAGKGIGTVQVV